MVSTECVLRTSASYLLSNLNLRALKLVRLRLPVGAAMIFREDHHSRRLAPTTTLPSRNAAKHTQAEGAPLFSPTG